MSIGEEEEEESPGQEFDDEHEADQWQIHYPEEFDDDNSH